MNPSNNKEPHLDVAQSIFTYFCDIDTNDVIPDKRKREMSVSLATFVTDLIPKYIRGQHEHRGDVTFRNLKRERMAELMDILVYEFAEDWTPIVPEEDYEATDRENETMESLSDDDVEDTGPLGDELDSRTHDSE